jgi:lipopolysaccharide transport protein LptA
VLKRLGESYEKQSPTLDRDQAMTVKAVERFTFLKNRYPTSPYAQDAESHIRDLNRKLGARELYVGEFYYKTGNYNASILRLEYFLKAYPEGADRDKALHYLAEDYRELSEPAKEQYCRDRLKREYPKSIYVRAAKKERRTVVRLADATTPAVAPPVVAVKPAAEAAPVAPVTPPTDGAVQTPKADAGSSVAANLNYDEKKKREIDLRPPEPAPPSAVPKVEVGDRETLSKSEDAEPGAKTAPSSEAEVVKSGTGNEAPAGEKIESGSKTARAGTKDAAAERADKKETPGPNEKKNKLGFFTEKKPVDVVADTMEAFEKGKTIVFKGNVVAKQEGSEPGQTLFLFSDKLTAYRTDESSDIQKAEAEGNVKVVKAQRTATCKQAFFYNDKGEVVLKGDVVVFEGNDRLTGDTATYYLNEDRIYVQGDKEKRARVIVTPKK